MHRIPALSLLLALTACASGSQGVSSRTSTRVVDLQGPGLGETMATTRTSNYTTTRIDASPEQVWSTLTGLYPELGLQIGTADTKAMILGGTTQRTRRIAGKGMATYFSCPGAYENLAATGDLYLSVRTQLLPAEGGKTEARTEVSARAKPQVVSGNMVDCSSTGALEKLIGTRLGATGAASAP